MDNNGGGNGDEGGCMGMGCTDSGNPGMNMTMGN
jgi:hypothetical protein